MGRAPTKSQDTSIRYQMLKKAQARLARAGIAADYAGSQVVFPKGQITVGKIGPASNGETAYFLKGAVTVPDGVVEIYDGFSDGHKVLDRIVEVYGNGTVGFGDLPLYATFTVRWAVGTLGKAALEPGNVYRKTGARKVGLVVAKSPTATATVFEVGLRSPNLTVIPASDPSARPFADLPIGTTFRIDAADQFRNAPRTFTKDSETTYSEVDRPFPLLFARTVPVLNPDVQVYV